MLHSLIIVKSTQEQKHHKSVVELSIRGIRRYFYVIRSHKRSEIAFKKMFLTPTGIEITPLSALPILSDRSLNDVVRPPFFFLHHQRQQRALPRALALLFVRRTEIHKNGAFAYDKKGPIFQPPSCLSVLYPFYTTCTPSIATPSRAIVATGLLGSGQVWKAVGAVACMQKKGLVYACYGGVTDACYLLQIGKLTAQEVQDGRRKDETGEHGEQPGDT